MILIQYEFSLSAAVTKKYHCTQLDVQKIVRNSLPNVPSRVRRLAKNCHAVEEESYPVEIKLKNEESNEDWWFTQFSKVAII